MIAPTPTVSVIMAAYNGAAWIADTIDSVIAQTLPDFELIIVDDRSTDDTRAIVARYADHRIRLIESATNGGPVLARNHAFAHARGRYVAALDQDDLCRPERFARQARFLDENPATVLVGTAARILEGGRVQSPARARGMSGAVIDWRLKVGNPFVWSSVMFRRDAASRLQPFTRPDRLYAEDFDLYHRLRPFGALAWIETPLVDYRRHPGGASQRFTERMIASAALVLADANRDALGAQAGETATLIARHAMAQFPANARALATLGTSIDRLQRDFLARHDPDPADRRAIERDASRLWWRLARTATRAGMIGVGEAMLLRPRGIGIAGFNAADLFVSRLIGAGRAGFA